ncbi:MAG: hypothetical protein PF568_01445 [Deltaproteobacteria bacterium]|nr:hypothetical protein [Deltaproteobacteria bacterium]
MPPTLHKKLMVVGILLLLTTIAGRQTGAATPVTPMLEMTADGCKVIKSQGKTLADIAGTIPAKESIGITSMAGLPRCGTGHIYRPMSKKEGKDENHIL